MNGTTSRGDCRPNSSVLSELEEQVLEHYLLHKDDRGYGFKLTNVEDMANRLLNSRGHHPWVLNGLTDCKITGLYHYTTQKRILSHDNIDWLYILTPIYPAKISAPNATISCLRLPKSLMRRSGRDKRVVSTRGEHQNQIWHRGLRYL